MATEIKDLTFEKALELLKSGHVLNTRSFRKINIYQVLYKNDEYFLTKFNCYGTKTECCPIPEDLIMDYIRPHDNYPVSYHKQKISKKSNDDSIVDEETAKILVYDWLLKKYKNEDDVIVPEITLGSRRADYMAFGKKEICVVEIKSEVDTIERLQEQINQYIMFANLVYIATHKNKISSIDKLDIPDFVGIIEIDKKLKVVKAAKKQKIDFGIFRGFVSYQEFLVMRSGFKGSTSITKMDMEIIFDRFFTEKQKSDFLFELMKNRHSFESKKRLDIYKQGDVKRAVGNANSVGINRMSENTVSYLSLKIFFNLDENFVKNYLDELSNKIASLYNGCIYLELLKNDWLLFVLILKRLQISYRSNNSSILNLFLFIDNSKVILENREIVKDIIDLNIREAISKALEARGDNLLIIETHSKEAQRLIKDRLSERQVAYKAATLKSDFFGVIKTAMFDGRIVLVLDNKIRKFFHLEKGISKIELWDRDLMPRMFIED